MAHDYATISDLIADKLDVSTAEVTDLAQRVPLLAALPLIPSSDGARHQFTREFIPLTNVGFREENTGKDMDHSVDISVTVSLEILDWSFEVDKAVADSWMRGGAAEYIRRENIRHLRSSLQVFETQIFYGDQSPGDSEGFQGLLDSPLFTSIGDQVLDAGGNVGGQMSSVWAFTLGAEDVCGVRRGDTPMEYGPTEGPKPSIGLDSLGKHYPVYYTPACTWLGLAIHHKHAARRLANVGSVSATLTDDLLSTLVESFPVDHKPTHLVMSQRSQRQLQRSRTAYSETGEPAPLPRDYNGTPIIVTDNILDTESVVS